MSKKTKAKSAKGGKSKDKGTKEPKKQPSQKKK